MLSGSFCQVYFLSLITMSFIFTSCNKSTSLRVKKYLAAKEELQDGKKMDENSTAGEDPLQSSAAKNDSFSNNDRSPPSTEAMEDIYEGKTVFLKSTYEESLLDLGKEQEEKIKVICQRNANKTNVLIEAVCNNNERPKSLVELQNMLGLDPTSSPFTFTGHSSSLVARNTSAINPRLILLSSNRQDANY